MPWLALVTVLALAFAAAPAPAGPWSAPAELQSGPPGGCKPRNPFPQECLYAGTARPAVNAKGEALVAWSSSSDGIWAAYARRNGRFGRAQRLGSGLRPEVALDADGRAVVVWTHAADLQFARAARAGRFGPARRLAKPLGNELPSDDHASLLALPGGGVLVVYESQVRAGKPGSGRGFIHRIRAVELGSTGPPPAATTLAHGNITATAASPSGGSVICCAKSGRLLTRAPGSTAWTTTPVPDAGYVTDVAADDAGPLVAIDDSEGNGIGASRGAYGEPLGEPLFAPVGKGTSAFRPLVAFDGQGRTVLTYHESSFEGEYENGPLYVVSARPGETFGPRIRLDPRTAYEPLLKPLPTGVLIAWSVSDRWNLATLRKGILHRVRVPAGGPSRLLETATSNRGLATAGPYAALAWTAPDGAIRASVASYP
jgi:hypothetical protein